MFNSEAVHKAAVRKMTFTVICLVIAFAAGISMFISDPKPDVRELKLTLDDVFYYRTASTNQNWVELNVLRLNPPYFSPERMVVELTPGQWAVKKGEHILFFVERVDDHTVRVFDTEEGAGWFRGP